MTDDLYRGYAASLLPRKWSLRWPEFVIVILLIAALALILMPEVNRMRTLSRHRSSCAWRLKLWGSAFAMYASESEGNKYPPIHLDVSSASRKVGIALTPRLDSMWPDYLSSDNSHGLPPFDCFLCPDDESVNEEVKDLYKRWESNLPAIREKWCDLPFSSYVYLGWFFDRCNYIKNYENNDPLLGMEAAKETLITLGRKPLNSEGGEIQQAPAQAIKAFAALASKVDAAREHNVPLKDALFGIADSDLVVGKDAEGNGLGNLNSETVHRLQLGIDRLFAKERDDPGFYTPPPSEVFVMFDNAVRDFDTSSIPCRGIDVLFLDGHVEFYCSCNAWKAPLSLVNGNLLTALRSSSE